MPGPHDPPVPQPGPEATPPTRPAVASPAPTAPPAPEPPAHGDASTQAPPARGGPPARSDDASSPTARWVAELGEKVRAFAGRRGLKACAVKVTLVDGEWFFVDALEPGPGEGFVSFSAYPPPAEMAERMVPVSIEIDGAERNVFMTPRVVVARVEAVRKVELLSDPPRDHPVGFSLRTDLIRASATPGP